MTGSLRASRRFSLLAIALLMAATVLIASDLRAAPVIRVHPNLKVFKAAFASPPTTSDCLAAIGIRCYQPAQLIRAYNINPLRKAGIDGRGETILIVDAFGSPTLASDLQTFDSTFGLPAPPSLVVRQDAGAVPPFDPTNPDMIGWAFETSLDVQWAHAFAPGARIVVEATPVAETEGVQGFPEIVQAENFAINHGMGDVISQSFAATEQTFPNNAALLGLRSSFENAKRHHVTVLAGTGDAGATNFMLDLQSLYPFPVTAWPATDPLVTAIGGTQLTLDDAGKRLLPDAVWNDGFGATGGGQSSVFKGPSYQEDVRSITGKMRGVPDISMSAAVDGGVLVQIGFFPDAASNGLYIVGGTSESTPEFAGIVAMADQVAGHRLGLINTRLYEMHGRGNGIVDVKAVAGKTNDNSFAGVTGFPVLRGYDLSTGLGTVDAAVFVQQLAGQSDDSTH
jgi:subtilase family serine protease